MAIDLNFNEEQQLIWNTAKEFFQKNCPIELVRKYDNAEDFPQALWGQMADLGWLGMAFRSGHGGLGMGVLDMYPVFVELGRSLAPVPALETVALAGGLIAAVGSEAQKAELLRAIAAGEAIVSPAILEP